MDNTVLQKIENDRAMEGTLPRDRTVYGMADINVSESKLRGFDLVGVILAIIMLLGPLTAGGTGMH